MDASPRRQPHLEGVLGHASWLQRVLPEGQESAFSLQELPDPILAELSGERLSSAQAVSQLQDGYPQEDPIRYCDHRSLNQSDSQKKLEASFQYQALIGLAKEAGAYKREQGVEYVKLLRVVRGVRHHRGRPSFKFTEVCENADVEEPVAEVSVEKFMIEQLASDIHRIIIQ